MAFRQGVAEAVAYHTRANGMPTNADYTIATLGYYAQISWYNFDHFGPDARAAYTACHAVALDLAAAGNGNEAALKEAYFMDAWGLHFLTDIFSSGHLRAPRRVLHDNNAAKAFLGAIAEVPVWDIQCRYFHDEDSACGLLVSNEEGSEWIAYGDKEYFSGHGRINRLRCERAVQASVDEVYAAFNSGSVPAVSSYAALRLAPKLQQAVVSSSNPGWSHDTFDSFPPLWIYNPSSNTFVCRTKIDDHSDYSWETAYPGYEWWPPGPSKKASSIKSSVYRKSGQYPPSKPLELESGGFVQIQRFPDDVNPASWSLSANVFGPIAIDLPSASLTFSLRNRTRKFATNATNIRILHWSKYFHTPTGKTSFVRFTHAGDPTHDLKVDGWSFELNQPDKTSQVVDFTDLDKSPLIFTQDFSQISLVPKFPGPGLSSVRYFVAPWTDPDPTRPDIIAVTFPGEKSQPRITVLSSSPGLLPPFTQKLDFLDTAAPKSVWSHVKLLHLFTGTRLLVANAVPTDIHISLLLRDYTYTPSTGLVVHQITVTLDGAAGQQTHLLVGDVLSTGEDQLIVTTDNRVMIFHISTTPSGTLSYTLASTPSATGAVASGKNQTLTAILGSNILTISSIVLLEKRTVEFVVSKKGGPGVLSSVEDVMWGPGFVEVEWLGVGETEVMEVFKWYGMLGVRVWGMKEEGGWEVVGLCATLGQVATMSGEVLQWGPEKGFADVDWYNPRPEI
ncbi:hypothetical protein BDD12DRAFT_94653 [Trichophaea hybrida]|nr:hypothetical protein BDD12DRAFT_94653 [Trichophaea hybrida]